MYPYLGATAAVFLLLTPVRPIRCACSATRSHGSRWSARRGGVSWRSRESGRSGNSRHGSSSRRSGLEESQS